MIKKSPMYANELFWEQKTIERETWHEEWNGVREKNERHEAREWKREKPSHTNLTEEIFYRDWQPFLLGWTHQSLLSSSFALHLSPSFFSPFFCSLALLISPSISLSSLSSLSHSFLPRLVRCWVMTCMTCELTDVLHVELCHVYVTGSPSWTELWVGSFSGLK